MKKFIREMLTDEKGSTSSKRTAGMLCVLSLILALLINILSGGKFEPSPILVNAISVLAFSTLGLTTIDKFSPPNLPKKEEE